jgi:hypothetical protein
MIIELPRNALNETQHQHPCRFGDNRLNMAQKGLLSVQNHPKVLNLLDMFKFMTPKSIVKPNGFLISIKINRLAICSVQAKLSSRAPLLQAVQITLKPVAIVNTFNGHKVFEIIGIAQGGNMLKIQNISSTLLMKNKGQGSCPVALRNGSKLRPTRNHQARLAECGQSNKTKTHQAETQQAMVHSVDGLRKVRIYSIYLVSIFNFVNDKIRKLC